MLITYLEAIATMTIEEQICSKSIEKGSSVVKIINSLRAEGMTDGSIREFLLECERGFELNNQCFEQIVDCLLKAPLDTKNTLTTFVVYEDEWNFLLNINNEEVRALFGVLIYVAKINWHDSGWIKYDEPQIMQLLGMKDHKKFLELVHQAVKLKLEFRVVGSKNPILCFKLPVFVRENEDELFALDYSLQEFLAVLRTPMMTRS